VRALVLASLIAVGCSSSADNAENGGADSSVADAASDTLVDDTSMSTDSTVTADSSSEAGEAAVEAAVEVGDAASDSNVAAETSGEAGVACTGTGATCSSAEVCSFPAGACGVGMGTCVTKPGKGTCAGAPEDPVCGCDGTSYSNPCFALLAGTSVMKGGMCPPPGCGNGTCELGENCSTCPSDCGACTGCGDGVCIKGTEDCASCPADCCATTCTESTKCAGDQFCKFLEGACKTKGATGSCIAPPTTCPPPGAGDLVCGCDGTSYSSECQAALGGTSVAHTGACL
jgi:hypothetical protein